MAVALVGEQDRVAQLALGSHGVGIGRVGVVARVDHAESGSGSRRSRAPGSCPGRARARRRRRRRHERRWPDRRNAGRARRARCREERREHLLCAGRRERHEVADPRKVRDRRVGQRPRRYPRPTRRRDAVEAAREQQGRDRARRCRPLFSGRIRNRPHAAGVGQVRHVQGRREHRGRIGRERAPTDRQDRALLVGNPLGAAHAEGQPVAESPRGRGQDRRRARAARRSPRWDNGRSACRAPPQRRCRAAAGS